MPLKMHQKVLMDPAEDTILLQEQLFLTEKWINFLNLVDEIVRTQLKAR